MIELLGVGVRKREAWRLRRVCARFESRTFGAVLAPARDERVTLLDVIAGREIPSEGRAWIDGTPLSAGTASRVRRRVGVVDVAGPIALDRTAAWNVARLGGLIPRAWLGCEDAAGAALARVGLEWAARLRARDLAPAARMGVIVARALRRGPGHLVVPEPDASLAAGEVRELIALLRGLVVRDGLSVFVSFGDPDLAGPSDAVVRVPGAASTLA